MSYSYHFLNARRTCALGPAVLNKHWAPMAADHSARGSMKIGLKPEIVCELQDTNEHRQIERKWRLPISVGKLSALEGRLINLHTYAAMDVRHALNNVPTHVVSVHSAHMASSQVPILASSQFTRWRPCPDSQCVHRVNVCVDVIIISTSGVLDHALNLSISLSAGKETKWDSPSNGE